MLPGPAKLYAYSHCGKKKAMFSMMSGNTFGATLWSDGRSIYPMRRSISLIQKCDSCNSYLLFSEWKEHGYEENNYNGTTGKLTYEETKDAYTILTESGRYDSDDVLVINLEFIRSYNDKFKRSKNSPEENDDFILFNKAADEAIKLLRNDSDSLITNAELFRERKDFRSAREILLSVHNEKNSWVVEPMLYFCNRFDNSLFPLVENGKKREWSHTPNYEAIVKGELIGLDEAQLYLNEPILNTHLREIVYALLSLPTDNPEDIFVKLDSVKLKSSMTLFDAVSPEDIFSKLLDKYFNGQRDYRTISILRQNSHLSV